MKKKLLVIGSDGMLGQELVKVFKKDGGYEVAGWDFFDIDITQAKDAAQKVLELKPDFILNAAAYNAVDKAEDPEGYELAMDLNGKAPGNLAKIAKKIGAVLVHFSTDYVFDGQPDIDLEPMGCTHSCGSCRLHDNFTPEIGFRESDKPNPISKYGKSKLWGEKAVMKNTEKYYLIRLSKLFGKPGKGDGAKRSFFEVMLEAGRKNKEVKVIDEETSCFTYAPDLAKKTKEIMESQKPFGIYHVTNSGACTWYEAVVELYRQAKLKTDIVPISASEFPRPAKRPFISTLINTKLNPLRNYKLALKDFISNKS